MASVASTYARAFADVVFSAHLDAARALGGLRQIVELVGENVDLRRVWENPAVPADQKRKLLDAIAKRGGIDRQVRNLVAVLIDHRRLAFLPRIVDQLAKELDARMGFAEAQISSARELGETEKRSLEAQIEKTTGKKVRASYGLDASLLGGAVIRVGSTIYDGSVKGQLEKIKEAISS
ncbi:MAG TPA: ATP synthase F1 subunit delta [Candidatus Dormibacteraeota bacterium]|nr:ATP synthase F1 subunit delta [Candidatus Dormibacteraeota bacterium]